MKYLALFIGLIFVNWATAPYRVTHFPGVQHGYDIGFGITLQVFENANYSTNAANKNRLIVFLGGSGETDSTTLKAVGWSKRVGSLGWNGKQYIASTNDTAYYTIISIPTTGQSTDGALNTVLNWFFANWPNFDTSVHANFNLSGLSLGAGNDVCYKRNCQGNFTYYKIFQNLVLGSVTNQDVSSFPTTMVGVHAKMYEGLADTVNGCCNPINSIQVYNAFPVSPPYKQLTLIPGAGHDATVWDSMTSPLALTAANNSAIWMADPYVGVDTDYTLHPILDGMVSDNSGCDGRTCNIMGYFNMQNTADPAHGINPADTVNGDIRGPENEYRYKATRVIEINLQKEVWGKRLYGYQMNTTNHPDTLDIYLSRTGGPAWFAKINGSLRDSTPNYRIIQDGTGSAQWKQIATLNDTFQHMIIMIRYQSFFTTFPVQIQSGYSDFILYAKDIAIAPELTYNYLTDAQALAIMAGHKRPMRNFNGTNHGNDDLPHAAYAFSKYTRMYRPWIYYQDSAFNHIIQTGADFLSFANWCDTLKLLNSYADIYAEITGPNYWSEFKQFGKDTGYLNPSTDSIGMPRNKTNSYKRYSQLLYGVAAMYHHAGDTTLFTAVGGAKPFHAGIFSKVQINNEDDDWNFPTLCNLPTERVQRSRAAYDGDGNTMGAGAGLKNADPSSSIIYGSFVGWNYRPMLTTIRFAQYAAGSRTVPWDIMAGHIYFSNLWENVNLQQTDRVGTHGVFPGQHYSLDTLAKIRLQFYKTLGYDMDFYLDEVGWDRTFQYPTTTGQLFSVTSFGLPHIGSYDSNQVQGICLTSSQVLLWRFGYDAMVQFQGTNADNSEGNGPFARSNIWLNYTHMSGGATIYDSTHYYPGWYMMNGLSNRMGDFVYDYDVIAPTDGGKFIYHGHKPGTDTVCYIVGVIDTLNTGQAFSLDLSRRLSPVTKWVPSFTTVTPGDSGQSLSGNTLNGTATPLIQVFFLRELPLFDGLLFRHLYKRRFY